jgi:hypothetical protein
VTTFKQLREINVNEHTEKKSNLTYLSWAWAWDIFKQNCPDATYKIHRFDGKPYLFDENTGYMVFTEVTANGETYEMWLPVMDGANNAMKDKPYTYTVMGWHPTERGKKIQVEKSVDAATMFDINKTIMRCLTKNLAMFGLGLYIYAGEDLPDVETSEQDTKPEKLEGRMADNPDIQDDMKANGYDPKKVYDDVLAELNKCQNTEMLSYWVKMNKTSRRMNGMPSDLKDDITAKWEKLKQHFAEEGK